MDFNSLAFLCFWLVLMVGYWRLPNKFHWGWLLAGSLYFYYSWHPAVSWIIFASLGVTYVAGFKLGKKNTQRSLTLGAAILFNISLLFFFKYFNFVAQTTNLLPELKVGLPLGISFYTFQMIAYLVDVYRGKVKPEKNIGVFALFTLFFPKLIAGPIERATTFLPQLKAKQVFKYSQVVSGLQLFTFGLFKKVVVADNLGFIVDRVFDPAQLPEFKGLSLVLTIILFSWQIYADFSGYTDMARGIARVFGIQLLENFDHPYTATSLRDFWRRWHMSLSSWFKDYLYIPLGGNRHGLVRTILNTLIVFIVCGLWHGAAWTFVAWGTFHGLVIAGERVFDTFNQGRIKFPKLIAWAYTYSLVSISWVLFRASNLNDALYIYKNAVVGVKNFVIPNYVWATLSKLFVTNQLEMAVATFSLVSIIAIEVVSNRVALGQFIRKQPLVLRYGCYVAVIMTIVLLRNFNVKEFIYVQF